MKLEVPPGSRVSGSRLAALLGNWRSEGARRGAAELAGSIELLVLDGRLPSGTQLPAERELAAALGASRTMVATALDKLRSAGLLHSRRGAGSWVAVPPGRHRPGAEHGKTGDTIDLSRAAPPALPGVAAAFDAARQRLSEHLNGHGYCERGDADLRARIAERFTGRGLPTGPDEVIITSGAHHAFVLALQALVGPGDRVLMEQPTYPNALDAVRGAHAVPVPVAMGTDGWDLDAVEAALRQTDPRLAYLLVDFQNPTGLRMPATGRERLARAVRRARTPVVADETQVEIDLEGEPEQGPPPLAAFGGEWVITVGSASKSHWGGFRIGWVRASTEILHRLLAARASTDLGSPVFEQMVLAELMRSDDDALRRRRVTIREQRDSLVDAVHRWCPEWTFSVPEGGLSLWCRLPGAIGTQVAVAAGNHGLRLPPSSRFGVHGGFDQWIRLHYALETERIEEMVRRVSIAELSVRGSGVEGSADAAGLA